jgi:nicotinamide-nucleotide amidase
VAKAEIIAVGSELLTPQCVETNSLAITEHLNILGVDVAAKEVIGDDRARLADAIRTALNRSEIVVVSGGLGPTEDDVTREAAAAALSRRLLLSLEQESILVRRFRQINRPMAPNNLRQAYLIEGAEALPNPNGSAPGQFVCVGPRALVLLPGPPKELKPMLANEVVPRLKPMLPPQVIKVRTFRITGIGESDLDALIAPIYTKYANPVTTILSSPGDLLVHLRACCKTQQEACALLREVGNPIAELVGERIYSENPEEPLEAVVGCLLRKHGAKVATAESCTGGLIASRLTERPGSSDFFIAGFVTYSEAQKRDVLGVKQDLLAKYTPVSERVAAAMAEGAVARTGATFALSTTGYAGPDGGTPHDPVGTVYIGIAGPAGTRVVRVRHGGDRYRIRTLATQSALDLLRRTLLK